MNKDIFEIAMRDQLRSAESAVPADAWAAIQSGIKSGASAPTIQSGSSFSGGFGIAAGAALLISLATYSEIRTEHLADQVQQPHHMSHNEIEQSHDDRTVILAEGEQSETKALQYGDETTTASKSVADIVVVQKDPSSVVVNEAPNAVRIELEALEPVPGQEVEAVNVSSNEDEHHTHELAELKTRDVSVETEMNPELEELTQVDAIIGASEIIGYAPMTVKFDNLGDGADHEWDFGKYGVKYETSPEVTFDEPGVYNVNLSVANEANGDIVSDVIQVIVKEGSHFYYPNSITPNGDGKNDQYQVEGYLIKSFLMIITNQKGDIVFQTRDINQPWNCDEVVNDMGGTKYFVTYKAVGVDGKVYAKDRVKLNISF